MAGISDIRHELCLALALWNGNDPILKERMFGLTGPQGNHGEDVKEYWWYLEGLPSHALLKWRYHYPQAAFPYAQLVNHGRGLHDPELELLDTGVFDGDRYWSVDVTYAKASPTEVLMRIELENHGPDEATLHVLPTLWFRNTWSWDPGAERPRIERDGSALVVAEHRASPATGSTRRPAPTARRPRRSSARTRRTRRASSAPRRRRRTRRTASTTTSSRARRPSTRRASARRRALRYVVTVAGGGKAELRLRLHRPDRRGRRDASWSAADVRRGRSPRARPTPTSSTRRSRPTAPTPSACGSCARRAPGSSGASRCTRTTCAAGSTATRASRRRRRRHRHGRNSGWRHLDAFDVLAMPDPWEYPWFAAWDLGFHCVPWAHLDPAFAKYQLVVLLREWFQHPNGALPAYEWNFDDVNPPVHVMAALRVFMHRRRTRPRVPRAGLPEAADQLHVVAQPRGRRRQQRLQRRLPRARQHQPDRPLEPARGRDARAGRRHGVDGLLRALDARDRDRARARRTTSTWTWWSSSLEQFALIARALERQGLYDAEDGFFYDRLVYPSGESTQVKVQTISGLLPVLPAVGLPPRAVEARARARQAVRAAARQRIAETGGGASAASAELGDERIAAHLRDRAGAPPAHARGVLRRGGVPLAARAPRASRSATRTTRTRSRASRAPGSTTSRPSRRRRCSAATRTGAARSGCRSTTSRSASSCIYQRLPRRRLQARVPDRLGAAAHVRRDRAGPRRPDRRDLAARPATAAGPSTGAPSGCRPTRRGRTTCFFNEYFHGDNGAGLGAAHQTGWTALVADLILDPPREGASVERGTDIAE